MADSPAPPPAYGSGPPLPLNSAPTTNFSRAVRARLPDLAAGPRFDRLDRLHSYYAGTQDDHKEYDWDGYFTGYGTEASIRPGWFVPFSLRRPATTVPLAETIVGRLTSMLFGDQNRPSIHVDGDDDAERFVRALARESRLFQMAPEIRNLGGAVGAVALSYGFVDGRPRVEVHNAKHTRVLEWADRADWRPRVVLKAYRYVEEEWSEEAARYVERGFWYVRLWTPEADVVWERVPDRVAKNDDWAELVPPSSVVENPLPGETPLVWVQNVPTSEDPDGRADFAGQERNLDTLNRLRSATSKGAVLNADPTLVVRSDKAPKTVRKGSENAIFAAGGAEYLSLPGDALRAGHEELAGLRQDVLDACGVVVPSPEKLSGAAQSAAAIRLLYAPMTAKCDVLREQYGEMGLVRVLVGLLRLAKALGVGSLQMAPDVEREAPEGDDDETEPTFVEVEFDPGSREVVRLAWPPYFAPTWTEKKEAVGAVKEANGGGAILSRRTALEAVASLFGVEDVDAELETMEAESAEALARQAEEMAALAEFTGGAPGGDEEDEGDEPDEGGPGANENAGQAPEPGQRPPR